jgi:hypothetical protein
MNPFIWSVNIIYLLAITPVFETHTNDDTNIRIFNKIN